MKTKNQITNRTMTLLEEVKALDLELQNNGFKSWSYSRLTVSKLIKLLSPDENCYIRKNIGCNCEYRDILNDLTPPPDDNSASKEPD